MPGRSRTRRVAPEPPIYTFRVRIRAGWYLRQDPAGISREIEIAANQSMAELGELIPLAFGFDDPHLWSFFLSGRAWDRASEYTRFSQSGGFDHLDTFFEPNPAQDAASSLIRDVPFPGETGRDEFLLLFDYGDQWEFGVQLISTRDALQPDETYPRVSHAVGEAPPQYVEDDDDEGEERDDDARGDVPVER